MPSLLRL
jgi:hypothetical protein